VRFRRKRPTFHRDAYIERVVSILTEEFEWDDVTERIAHDTLTTWNAGRPIWFEIVCDPPLSAMYKLRAGEPHPWSLRVAYYGENPERHERARQVTARLAAALAETETT
jgi:hypothetical protein